MESRTGKPAARERKPSRNRLGHYLALILGSGVVAALIAIVIAAIPTVLSFAFPPGTGSQIQADQMFPTVSPVHQVVNVYDPPPAGRPTARPTQPPEHESPSSTPTPHAHPSGSPPPDE